MNVILNKRTKEVHIGSLSVGNESPILIQSMTMADSLDVNKTVEECIHLFEKGCPLIRLAIPSVKAAKNLKNIKLEIEKRGYDIPLVADIHFTPEAAEIASKFVEKVRINPGNFADRKRFESIEYTAEEYDLELKRIEKDIQPFIDSCRQNQTSVRIGVNHGSLSDRITSYYGDTPKGMVESALEYLAFFNNQNFENVVVSLKSSNPQIMIEANRLFVVEQEKRGWNFPLHLGVTEAGDGEDGRIKSALGIGTLLKEGIGDTIRVSLTENPENEIPVAQFLAEEFGRKKAFPELNIYAKNPTIPEVFTHPEQCNGWTVFDLAKQSPEELHQFLLKQQEKEQASPVLFHGNYSEKDLDKFLIRATVDFGSVLLNGWGNGMCIQNENFGSEVIVNIANGILQATRRKISKTEYISCPSCGRTRFDLQKTTAQIKEKTNHLVGLKIGIMGCIVNGPGEMADADYGYVGSGIGRITLYKKKEIIQKNIPEEDAVNALIRLIRENGDWVDP
ncbi:MAG: (E)-4-hydroxy-3-methylbut-2-enyl-diphosphate synthase [Crocinitomicaceae bacterium]|nr:(E)-4-hydroxy-3-methylbut-2-enyl-diphosphate synthase [Crocinitomicaceae bacterium]